MTCEYAISETEAAAAGAASRLRIDDEAFAAFYQQTARPLWAYLARVLANSALADDLVQESYLRFLCTANWEQGTAACRSYLFCIATNLMRDHWRRPMPTPIEEISESAHPRTGPDSDERLDSQALLGPAFARMRPRDRQLLWLAYAEGCTHKEIAHITGLGVTSIRILLFRARRTLAHLLRSQGAAAARDK